MTPREKQMVLRHKVKTVVDIVAIESVMVLVIVTWLLGIW